MPVNGTAHPHPAGQGSFTATPLALGYAASPLVPLIVFPCRIYTSLFVPVMKNVKRTSFSLGHFSAAPQLFQSIDSIETDPWLSCLSRKHGLPSRDRGCVSLCESCRDSRTGLRYPVIGRVRLEEKFHVENIIWDSADGLILGTNALLMLIIRLLNCNFLSVTP